ncbi:MAG: nucleotidyltransferase family protein [Acidobacteriota bacterium]|nr:nucleotidyltransferase family protein [Acidobacteriota bacterium]
MSATLKVSDVLANGSPADSPESALLLTCGRASLDETQKKRIQQLVSGSLDWDLVLQLADRHGLQPLLHSHLNAVCPDAVPEQQRQHLRVAFQRVSALNILLTHELQKLLALFVDNDIRAVPYKGPTLALQLYGNVALRQFSDLDILVHPRDVLRARDLLLAEGYAQLPPLTDGQQAVLLRTQCNLPFTRDRNRMIVELHWTVSAPAFARPFETDDFWSRLQDAELETVAIKLPATEDLLLALCIHGSKHLWERLAWVCDMAGLITTQKDLNWQELISRARATGSERMLFLGLRLATDLLAAPLPKNVEVILRADASVAALAQDVVRDLFTPALTRTGMSGYFRFQLRARRRLRDKLNYLRFTITPNEEDLVRLKLPPALTFIYYLVRPVRLVVTGGPSHFH